ncbi:SulP family inorganic anion transporter [Pseudomonas sp. N040]|uniref:SulP family inorganic anion transporter n=1 Tax=Pseudomonas sp. N040 TaxID=2785325 RepID=UPI001C613784|nr:SulP family inorganic anion transporter [Pseudomonas sp. N040]MBW7014406.1 SulP family inorganic anion transporter [Pseudomonas sp. N040]
MTIKQIASALKIRLLSGILPIRPQLLPRDIFAGLTLAAAGIPQAMGYTKIAETPVVTGFYTLLLPLLAFALLGGSRRLVVAADSATAAILAASLISLAPAGSAEYVGLASLVAFVVGLLLLAARFLQLGFLADFLSRSAIVGFMTGVGVQVACGQLAGLFGLHNLSREPFDQVVSVMQRLPDQGHWLTATISLAVILIILAFRRLAPKVPGALLAVVGMISASHFFNLAGQGVEVVGSIPSGLPTLSLPALHWPHVHQLLTTAATCFVVIIAQSAATSRSYGMRHSERVDENSDLVGLAGANAMAALSGTFVVNGTPTQTELVDGAGGHSQLAQVTTALVVMLVLLFLTGPLASMPMAVLSAIVFLVGFKLIDIAGLRDIYRFERSEFYIALATGLTVLVFDIMDGIAVAVIMSLVAHVRHTYAPRTSVLRSDDQGHLQPVKVAANVYAAKDIIVYRFEANLFYANAGRFMEEVVHLAERSSSELRWIVIDATGVNDIDYSAGKSLIQLNSELHRRNIRLACVATSRGVLEEIKRYSQTGKSAEGTQLIFESVEAALQALKPTVDSQ